MMTNGGFCQANRSLLQSTYLMPKYGKELQTTTLSLQFKLQCHHFQKGALKLKCVATIHTMFLNLTQKIVELENPERSPALDVKHNLSAADTDLCQRPGILSCRLYWCCKRELNFSSTSAWRCLLCFYCLQNLH